MNDFANNGPQIVPPDRSLVLQDRGATGLEYYRGYPHYPQYDQMEAEGEGFDLYYYIRLFRKYFWLIAGVAATALLIGLVITFLMTPIYRATVSIQIDRQTNDIVKMDGVQADNNGGNSPEFFQTQYELLGSRSLAQRVVTTLGLADDAQFSAPRPGRLASLLGVLGLGKETAPASAAGEDRDVRVDRATSRLVAALGVAPVRGSNITKINIDSTDPAMAAKIANGFAEVFIADNLDRRFDATSYARKFLEDRIQQLKAKLEDSERQLVKYAEDQGIINLDDNKNLTVTDLEAVNAKLADAHNDRIKKELLWKQAQQVKGLGLKEILDNPTIQENRKLRSQLAAQYQQKLALYKPAFPEMVQLRNQIQALDSDMETQVAAIRNSIEAQYLAAKKQEDELQAQLDSSKGSMVDQRNKSIQYNIIKREVDTNRSLYDGLLQRYKEIGVAGGVGTNNISIVDRAAVPVAPRSPSLPLNLGIALIGGLLLGFLAALTADYMDDTFKIPEDVERELRAVVLGTVPKQSQGASPDAELADSRSAMAEAYRSLRTGLQFATANGLPRSLLVTSSKPSEGKTTCSIALSRAFAGIGLRVLLIDCDLRNASVHKRLRQNNDIGLSNYLSGSKTPEDIVQRTETEGLMLIPAGPLPPDPVELLTGERMMKLMEMASASFDLVLLDGPPIMGLADAPLLSTMARSTMLVIAANETRKSAVKIAMRRLIMARASIVGTVLNKFDLKEAGYGYGYGYGEYTYSESIVPKLDHG